MLLLLRRPHRNITSFCAFDRIWKPTTDAKRLWVGGKDGGEVGLTSFTRKPVNY